MKRIIHIIILLILNTAVYAEVQKLSPWQIPDSARDVDPLWTSEYMNIRPPRAAVNLNRDWTFNYFPAEELDEGVSAADYNDNTWPVIAIPHTWQTYETTKQRHPFIKKASETSRRYSGDRWSAEHPAYWWYGWGIYRKHFVPDDSLDGKKIFVEFGAVMKYCRVWLNGRYLGDHKGGYNSFYFDVSDAVRFGKDNVLVVAVNNRKDDPHKIPPMQAGNWNPYGGICRDVSLVSKDKLHIPFQGSYKHEGGTFITTPAVSKDKATVHIKTYVRNDYDRPMQCVLLSRITDRAGSIIDTRRQEVTIAPGNLTEIETEFKDIANPKLWTPDTPNLYKLESTVLDGERIADRFESAFGFRCFEWDYKDNWLILNGSRLHLHGTNRQHEFAWIGDAIPKWMHIKDAQDIRFGLSHNFVRPNIYVNDALFHDLCDQFGMLMCICSPNIKNIDFSEEVQEQIIVETIRQNRNRPSVIIWSVGNETNDPADSAWVWKEDKTRIIHARHAEKAEYGEHVTHTHENMDMENLLRVTVRGWTDDDVMPANPVDGQHASNEERQHTAAMIQDASQRGKLDMHNGVMWLYNDQGANRVYKDCPIMNLNPKGWVDFYRIPKYMYYLWQANYNAEPMAFIHPHFWQRRYIGTQKDIKVDSNCQKIVLMIGDETFGSIDMTEQQFRTATFKNVGVCEKTLTLAGYNDGRKVVETKLPMAGKAAKLVLSASQSNIEAALDSVVIVTVDVVDANGVQVQNFTAPFNWKVEGAAKLLSPHDYTTDILKNNAEGGLWYITLPVSTVIRSTGAVGTATVSAFSEGLECEPVKIRFVPAAEKSALVTQPHLSPVGRGEVAIPGGAPQSENAEVPVMEPTFETVDFEPGRDVDYYAKQALETILTRQRELQNRQIELEILVQSLARHIKNNNGKFIADDYNFAANLYNRCVTLTDKIRADASLDDKQKAERIRQISYEIIYEGNVR